MRKRNERMWRNRWRSLFFFSLSLQHEPKLPNWCQRLTVRRVRSHHVDCFSVGSSLADTCLGDTRSSEKGSWRCCKPATKECRSVHNWTALFASDSFISNDSIDCCVGTVVVELPWRNGRWFYLFVRCYKHKWSQRDYLLDHLAPAFSNQVLVSLQITSMSAEPRRVEKSCIVPFPVDVVCKMRN